MSIVILLHSRPTVFYHIPRCLFLRPLVSPVTVYLTLLFSTSPVALLTLGFPHIPESRYNIPVRIFSEQVFILTLRVFHRPP